jgi:hypothetical protein
MRTFFRTRFMFAAALLTLTLFSAREAAAQTVGPGDVLISEFRLSGPGGFADEYMEFYCNRDADCDVSGYNIVAFDPSFGDFEISFPAGVVIPARGHLLIGDDAGYTLADYATLDLTASFGGDADFFIDNEGFQLRTPDDAAVIDSVGFAGGSGGDIDYVEGAGLERATDERPADQYAYVRKMGTATGGRPQDTNNNANDFVLVSVTGTPHPGITQPPVLGAPGPQSTTAPPTYDNSQLTGSLVEPAASASASPNRVVTLGGDNRYKLSIRRTVTNNTADTIGYLAFRVIDITTLNSPQVFQQQAQLRLITSGNAETFTNSQGRTVTIRGTVLEYDPAVDPGLEPSQPNGGGLNTSAAVPLDTGIAPGESVDVQFLLDVVQGGSYRFFVNVEALPSAGAGGFAPLTSSRVTRGAAPTDSVASRRAMVFKGRKAPSIRRAPTPTKRATLTRGTLTVTKK